MEEQATVIESLVEHVESYTKTTVELAKLRVIDKASAAISNIVLTIVFIVVGFLMLLLLSIGAALWVGELIQSVYGGFFIVAGFYVIVGLLLYLLREKAIKTPVSNSIINHFLD